MSKLSGVSTLSKRYNHGLKPVKNSLGSLYFATTTLSSRAEDGSGGSIFIPSSGTLTLSDGNDLILSNGQAMEILG